MPIEFQNAPSGGGGGASSTAQHGRSAIGNGASSVTVTFPTAFTNAPVTVVPTVEVPAGSPNITATLAAAPSLTEFTAILSAATDNGSYVLHWFADEGTPT